MPKATVIISTYNQPEWLEKCLWGYENQEEEDFDIIIADDGSNKDTESFINEFKLKSELRITHIWQEDSGFRKNIILNRAIQSSKADYLIFTDGDCIPRADFVNTHLRCRRQNSFLSGGYFKLPKSISDLINRKDIDTQKCFDVNWLLNKGLKKSFKINKLTSSGFKETILNMLTPTKATWDGMNVSAYKSDIINVNGYDERLSYGGEDRELGERLMNFGVKAIQIRYSAICLHLYHERGYVDKESWNSNNQIRKQVKKQKLIWSDFGIKRNS